MDGQGNMEIEINRDSFSDYLRKRYTTRPMVFDRCPDMLDDLSMVSPELAVTLGGHNGTTQ